MKKIAWTFGMIAGIVILVYSAVVIFAFGDFKNMTATDLQKVEAFGYLRYLILILAVLFGIREWRKLPDVPLNWWNLAKAGIAVALVVALFVGLFEMAYAWANPNFMEEYGRLYIENLQNSGTSEVEVAQAKQQMADFAWLKNPLASGGFYFAETSIVGALAAALLALFFKKG